MEQQPNPIPPEQPAEAPQNAEASQNVEFAPENASNSNELVAEEVPSTAEEIPTATEGTYSAVFSTSKISESASNGSESAPPAPPFDFSAPRVTPPPFTPPPVSPPIDAEVVRPEASKAPRKEKSNLFLRVLTALIGIPIVAWLVWRAGPTTYNFVVALLALLSLRELGGAMRRGGFSLVRGLAYPALLVLLFAQRIGASESRALALLLWTLPFVLLIGLLIEGVLSYGQTRRLSLQSIALTLLATFYVGLFSFVILLRTLKWPPAPGDPDFNILPGDDILPHLIPHDGPPLGPSLLWLTLLAVWAGDTVAYFVGRRMGKEKLTPLSPGKTWEGAVAGLTATIAVSVPIAKQLSIDIRHGLALGVIIALAAPLGDLAESFWKRELGVKDSGGCLPGHGGILDRCDSLLFAVFAVYFYAQLVFVG